MNAVIIAVLVMVALSLARVSVVFALVVGALVGGLVGGLSLDQTLEAFNDGVGGGAQGSRPSPDSPGHSYAGRRPCGVVHGSPMVVYAGRPGKTRNGSKPFTASLRHTCVLCYTAPVYVFACVSFTVDGLHLCHEQKKSTTIIDNDSTTIIDK